MARQDKYDINKIRDQVRKKVGKHTDPTEFKPPKADDGKPPIKFRFYILPPFQENDALVTGSAECGMNEFFLRNGSHYIDSKKLGCPRVINDDDCGICKHGFDLMSEIVDRDQRRGIAQRLLPGTYYMVNIYFPNIKPNPEELRGQVRWYNCPKTVFDLWEDCLYRDDDGGDPQEPLPFGVFYDEENAYLFQLEVVKQGQGNNYGKSKFFVTESMQALPIFGKVDHPDANRINEILAKRHNLFDKLPDVVAADIDMVARNLSGDSTGSGGFDLDETRSDHKNAITQKAGEPERTQTKTGIKPNITESSTRPQDDLANLFGGESGEELVAGEIPVDTKKPDKKKSKSKSKSDSESESESDSDIDVDALLDQLGDD